MSEENPYAAPEAAQQTPKREFTFQQLRMGIESDWAQAGYSFVNALSLTLASRVWNPEIFEKQAQVDELLQEAGFEDTRQSDPFFWARAKEAVRGRICEEYGLEPPKYIAITKDQRAARLDHQIQVDGLLERKALTTGQMVWLLFMDRNPSQEVEVSESGKVSVRQGNDEAVDSQVEVAPLTDSPSQSRWQNQQTQHPDHRSRASAKEDGSAKSLG